MLRAHAAIDGRADVLAQTPARLTDEQRQQRGREKAVAQRVPLVLRMVVDEHADDPGAVAGQQDARHAGDVPPLLEQRRRALHRLVRDLVRLPVDHVGDGRRAQAQLLRDITDAYTLLHVISPVSAVILSVLRREVKGSIGKITGFRKKMLVFCGGFAYDMYAAHFFDLRRRKRGACFEKTERLCALRRRFVGA